MLHTHPQPNTTLLTTDVWEPSKTTAHIKTGRTHEKNAFKLFLFQSLFGSDRSCTGQTRMAIVKYGAEKQGEDYGSTYLDFT
jgi:hypothetical protein